MNPQKEQCQLAKIFGKQICIYDLSISTVRSGCWNTLKRDHEYYTRSSREKSSSIYDVIGNIHHRVGKKKE